MSIITITSLESFLSALFLPDDLIEIRPIESWIEDGKKKSRVIDTHRQWLYAKHIPDNVDLFNTISQSERANIFFGVCPREKKGDGKKEDIKTVRTLWADVDNCTVDEALYRIREAELPEPSIVINSGHGIHLYWLLNTPVRIGNGEDRDHVESVIKHISKMLGSDNVRDLNRLLRLPDFMNMKDARNGAAPVLCELYRINGHKYDLTEIEDYLPKESIAKISNGGVANVDIPVDTSIIEWAVSLLTTEPKDGDRSKRDFLVLCGLIERGIPKEQARGIVTGYSKFASRTGQYFDSTWTAASKQAHQKYAHTDIGNSERFRDRCADELRYCASLGKWYQWDGRRWREDQIGIVIQKAKQVIRGMYADASKIMSDNERHELGKWAFKCEKRDRLNAMVELAKSERVIAITPDQFDNDLWALNVINGIIDLKTGDLLPHDRDRLTSKMVNVEYTSDARCERWDRFLSEIMGNNIEMIRFLQRLCGMFLTGDITEQILPIFYGDGSNGKGVLTDTLLGIMGEYACPAPDSLITVRSNDEHPTEIAALLGKRLVIASETEEGKRMRVNLVKKLTGDTYLTGRFMRQDYFTFTRTHKTVLVTNNKPIVRETKYAIWRRLRLVPFNVTIPDELQDKQLVQKLKIEWPGILRWLIDGCIQWQRDGLGEPPAVGKATKQYQIEQDPLSVFVEESCALDKEAKTSRSAMWGAYQSWIKETGERYPLKRSDLISRIEKMEGVYEAKVTMGNRRLRGWTGIGLSYRGPNEQE